MVVNYLTDCVSPGDARGTVDAAWGTFLRGLALCK